MKPANGKVGPGDRYHQDDRTENGRYQPHHTVEFGDHLRGLNFDTVEGALGVGVEVALNITNRKVTANVRFNVKRN